MSNYARVIENVAVDVSAAPYEHFHPTLAGEFVEVPVEVQAGWSKVDGTWSAPAAVEPAQPQPSYPATQLWAPSTSKCCSLRKSA